MLLSLCLAVVVGTDGTSAETASQQLRRALRDSESVSAEQHLPAVLPEEQTQSATLLQEPEEADVLFTGTYDGSVCSLTSCSFLDKPHCEVPAVLDQGLHYVYADTLSCKLLGHQYKCCAQTCKADSECPPQHYCQGFNSGQKYCYGCHDCP